MFYALVGPSELLRDTKTHFILVYMILFTLKSRLLSIKIDSQPLLFLIGGILKGVLAKPQKPLKIRQW